MKNVDSQNAIAKRLMLQFAASIAKRNPTFANSIARESIFYTWENATAAVVTKTATALRSWRSYADKIAGTTSTKKHLNGPK